MTFYVFSVLAHVFSNTVADKLFSSLGLNHAVNQLLCICEV